jgi:hypothetical protein
VTGDSLTYSTEESRLVELLWYNKDEDGRYIGFTDGSFDAELAKKTPDSEENPSIYYWIEWYQDLLNG